MESWVILLHVSHCYTVLYPGLNVNPGELFADISHCTFLNPRLSLLFVRVTERTICFHSFSGFSYPVVKRVCWYPASANLSVSSLNTLLFLTVPSNCVEQTFLTITVKITVSSSLQLTCFPSFDVSYKCCTVDTKHSSCFFNDVTWGPLFSFWLVVCS